MYNKKLEMIYGKIKKLYRNELNKESLFDNALSLTSGNAIAQALTFAAGPVLTRQFTSSEFGDFSIYLAGLTILSSIITFRLDYAILLPVQDESAYRLGIASIFSTVVLSLFLGLLLYLFPSLFDVVHASSLKKWILPLILNLILLAIFNTLNVWATRVNEFRILAKSYIINNTLTGITQSILGWCDVGGGLIWGQLLSRFSATMQLSLCLSKTFVKENFLISTVYLEVKQVRKFCIFNGLVVLLDNFLTYLPTLFLYSVYGAQTAGFYLLASRVVGAPASLITNSASNALSPRVNRQRFELREIQRVMSLAFKKLLLAAALLLPLLLVIVSFFNYIFGSSWMVASQFCLVLLVPSLLTVVVTPFSSYLICNDNKTHVIWRGFILACKVTVMFIAFKFQIAVLNSLIAIAVLDCILNLSYLFGIARSAGLTMKHLFKPAGVSTIG